MLRAIVFHGKKQFTAEYYAQEIKNRAYMAKQLNGYYKDYGNNLSYAVVGDRTFRVNSGLFLVQGRQCSIVLGTSEDVVIPSQESTLKGYIIARINTNVLAGDNVELTYKLGTNSSFPALTQQDTLNIDENTSAIYELPLYSFNIYRSITDVEFLLSPITNAQLQVDDGTGIVSEYLSVGGVYFKKLATSYQLKCKENSKGSLIALPIDAETLGGSSKEDFASSTALESHIKDNNNPHKVDKTAVGLSNVDNTSDLDKPISNDTKKALAGKADLVNGKLAVSQLPDSGITVDVAKKVIYKEEAKDIEEIFDEELNEDLILDIECDHEYEITAQTGHEYSLAIPDESSVKLKKIQGQTARYSLNEYNGTNIEVSSTDNVTGFVNKKINIKCSSNTKYTLSCNYSQSNSRGLIAIELNTGNLDALLLESSGSYTKTFTTTNETSFDISFYSCTQPQINSIIFSNIMFNEGEPLPYQPYDNTLVNSKCDFVSTNKNFFDKSTAVRGQALSSTGGLYTASDAFSSDFIRLPKGTYTVSRENENYDWYNKYDMNKVYTGQAPLSTNIVIDFDGYIRFSGMKDYIDNVILNYGTEPKPYVPHEKDTLIFSQEMGKFDSWENGLLYKQTSEFITLDGVNNKVLSVEADKYLRFGNSLFPNVAGPFDLVLNQFEVATTTNWNADEGFYFDPTAANVLTFKAVNQPIRTLEEWNTYFQQNPLTLAYKLATPTTQELPFTNIMKVWNSGLQQQKIEGKYLPYILTKEYAISLKAQVDNNTTENYLQDARIKENKAEIENLKTASVDYTRVYISEEGIYLNEKIRDVDYSIEELERRLDNLGFKEGVCTFTPSNAFQSLTTNTVKKQGKYVILNIDGNIAAGTETFTINLPDGFSPKENIVIISILNNTYFSPLNYDINNPGKITVIKTAGQYVLPFKIYNTGWETE